MGSLLALLTIIFVSLLIVRVGHQCLGVNGDVHICRQVPSRVGIFWGRLYDV